MPLVKTRAIAYGVVALLAVGAIFFTRSRPPRASQQPGELFAAEHADHPWRERHDTVLRGESLVSVLARGGVTEVLAREALKGLKTLDPRRVRVGTPVRVRSAQEDTIPTEITLQLAVDKFLHLKRDSSGWSETVENLPWLTDTVVVHAVIKSNLYAAMHVAARDVLPASEREELTGDLAEIFEYRVDMSRDLQVGDSFRVVAERSLGPQGTVRRGKIIGASARLSGKTTEAVRFASTKVGGDFFDANGKSMRAGFLRNPVAFRRISSRFGARRHPILGTMRKHQGTDYAANPGTPIRAVGDGVVIKAGWGNGYGNAVEVRHANGFITRYGHMRGFARGIQRGARVSIEQTIGYVGSTGMSTGPHLHFEVLVGGVQRNPTILQNASSDPIPAFERVAFAERRAQVLEMLRSPAVLATAESASVRQAGVQQQ